MHVIYLHSCYFIRKGKGKGVNLYSASRVQRL